MGSIRKLLLVGVGVLALHGVQACTSETELNPQPLPPQGGDLGDPNRTPDEAVDQKEGSPTGGGPGGGSSGTTSPAPNDSDGGTKDGGPG